jgi:hypothetical protein
VTLDRILRRVLGSPMVIHAVPFQASCPLFTGVWAGDPRYNRLNVSLAADTH